MPKGTARALCIELSGEVDHHHAEQLRRQLDRAIDRCRGGIILDFSGVSLMDSSGIGLLIGRYKRLHERGPCLYVKNLNSHVDKLFRISGLYSIVEKLS